jgi:hypothetical protein
LPGEGGVRALSAIAVIVIDIVARPSPGLLTQSDLSPQKNGEK